MLDLLKCLLYLSLHSGKDVQLIRVGRSFILVFLILILTDSFLVIISIWSLLILVKLVLGRGLNEIQTARANELILPLNPIILVLIVAIFCQNLILVNLPYLDIILSILLNCIMILALRRRGNI